jgi:hypothetical protein
MTTVKAMHSVNVSKKKIRHRSHVTWYLSQNIKLNIIIRCNLFENLIGYDKATEKWIWRLSITFKITRFEPSNPK